MSIIELRNKRNEALKSAKAFLEANRTEDGTLTKENDEIYAKMEETIVNLGKEISRLEKLEELDNELSKPVNTPIKTSPAKVDVDEKSGRASKKYKDAFWKSTRTNGFKNPEVINALQEGTDSEGGYLVPEEFEHTLVEALSEENVFRSHARVITTGSNSHKIPVVAQKGSASWIEEEGEILDSDDTFGQKNIEAHKVGTAIKVSKELLADSAFDLEGYFTREFSRRIGDKEEDAFINGDGSHKPTGILHSTDGADVGVTTATATAITADEVIDLFYSLKAPYRKNAIWLLNDQTVKAIRKLKDGAGQYLWQPALTAGAPDTLLGKPVFTSAFFPTIAAGNKTIAFGDFSYYWIGDREGISFQRLDELYAKNGQVGFLAVKRLDGKLILSEAIKVLKQHA